MIKNNTTTFYFYFPNDTKSRMLMYSSTIPQIGSEVCVYDDYNCMQRWIVIKVRYIVHAKNDKGYQEIGVYLEKT